MFKRIFAAFLAFVLVFSCVPAIQASADSNTQTSGTTYYVSSLHGAEGNNGTSEETPFASLLKINEIELQPGDKVLLERGSVFVNEYLHVQGSGSAEASIIIDAYGDENADKPLIQTNGYGVWYQDYGKRLDNQNHVRQGEVSSCILLKDVEYIEISNIAMTNEGNFAEGEVYNTAHRMNRTGVAGVAQNIGTVDHIVLKNLDIYNVQGNVYDKHMCNGGIYLVCHLAEDASTGVARYDDVLIENCTLDEVNRWGIAVGYTAYWDQFAYGSSIDANVCQTYGSTNVKIRNNYLTNVGGDAITTMYCYQPVIEYNVADVYATDMNSAIYAYPENRGGIVAAGIWPWMCKTPYFQYNECYSSVYNQDGQAWDADWGDNAIYQYNYSCNNAGGAVMFCGTYACNTVFRYNISQNDLSGVLNLAGSPNGEIYNNVFYIKEGVKINRDGMSGGYGNTISNNIFYYTGSEPASAVYGNWNAISAEWDSNIYYNYATTPADAHAITADPMFVDPGKGPTGAQENGKVHDRSVFDGYKLQENSPAIDAGVPIENNGGKDFFGNALDLIPDIGAHEIGALSSGTATQAVVVDLELGESVSLTDTTGDYSAADTSELNTKIATVELEAVAGGYTVGSVVSELTSGNAYYIASGRDTTNAAPYIIAAAKSGSNQYYEYNALQMQSASAAQSWTITSAGEDGKYYVCSADGKYLSVGNRTAQLVDDATALSLNYNSQGYWTVSEGAYYLNHYKDENLAFGWDGVDNWGNYDASTDVGSFWVIHAAQREDATTTKITFTGKFPGQTNVTIGKTLYKVRVGGTVENVGLQTGDTASYTDTTGIYTDANTDALNTDVATVELTAVSSGQRYEVGQALTALEDGKYLIVHNRAEKPLVNAADGNKLTMNGSTASFTANAVWTVKSVEGGYTVQDANGKYLTVGASTAAVVEEPVTLTMSYNTSVSAWEIGLEGQYLNQYNGKNSNLAAGWRDGAAGDEGSRWRIYGLTSTDEPDSTKITFTGVGQGETTLVVGDVAYAITVTEKHTHAFDQKNTDGKYLASEATCEHPATYHYSCTCGEAGEETFEHGALGAHVDEDPMDEICDVCGEDLAPEQSDVIRLQGKNRHETALKIADEMKEVLGVEKFDTIIVANGYEFFDALSGSYLAAVKKAPILLSYSGDDKYAYLNDNNLDYIKANLAENGTVYILGGENAVPTTYDTELAGYGVTRLDGAHRFDTNLKILEEAGVPAGSEILVCTAEQYADSLSAAATGKPILLVQKYRGVLYGLDDTFLSSLENCTFTIIGGKNAVSWEFEEVLKSNGYTVDRLAGSNRFETSVEVAERYFQNVDQAVLAYANGFPDGLCGGSLAYAMKAPLILTMTGFEGAAADYANDNGITSGVVLGGAARVSDASVREIFNLDEDAVISAK